MLDRHLPVLSVTVGSHVAPMWPRLARSLIADASSAPVLDQGPERPAGHGKADQSPENHERGKHARADRRSLVGAAHRPCRTTTVDRWGGAAGDAARWLGNQSASSEEGAGRGRLARGDTLAREGWTAPFSTLDRRMLAALTHSSVAR